LLPKQQTDAAREQIDRFEKAVPFTTQDVVEARFGNKKTLGETSEKIAKPSGVLAPTPVAAPSSSSGLTQAEKDELAALKAKHGRQ
jgi:hypothetical protein